MLAALIVGATLTVNALSQDPVDGTYYIYTPQDLVDFAAAANSNKAINAKLMADIDMTGVSYTPPSGYYGIFDGQGHTISGLKRDLQNVGGGNYGLLFDVLGNGYNSYLFGEVMNLTMKDSSINVTSTSGEVFVGALVGKLDRHDIYDVSFENVDVTFNGTGNSSGALAAGITLYSSIRDERAEIRLFGITADADCSVTSTDNMAGAIIGKHNADCLYVHGVNTAATITSAKNVAGGVIGRYNVTNNPKFINITVAGSISGKNVGAIAGDIFTGRKTPIFAIANLTNTSNVANPVGWYEDPTVITYYDDVEKYGKAPNTDDGNFMISTADELRWFAKYVNGDNNAYGIRLTDNAFLTADIDMTGKEWTPMAKYRGTFDGQGHTIKGLSVTVKDAANDTKHGLIAGMVGNNYNSKIFGRVQNLTVADSTLTVSGNGVKYNVGGIAGESNRGSFYNITMKNVDISVTGNLNKDTVVGGIAGWVAYAPENPGRDYIQSYHNCHLDKECSITSDSANVEMGGIFGILGSECVRVLNCTVGATLTGKGNVGGIAGNISSGGNRWYMISDCGFFGNITDGASSGGIVGYASKNGFIVETSVNGSIAGTVTGELVGTVKDGFNVHTSRISDGALSVSNSEPISLFSQTRPTAAGHDLRIILLADMAKMGSYEELAVTISFYDANDALVKAWTGKLSDTDSDYTLFKSIVADNETYTADEGCALFGNVIADIPDGAYSYFTVDVTDGKDTAIKSGTTKPAEGSSLEGKTFYFLGSSVTYGSASGGKSMADFIAERNNCTVVKEAVSGTTLVDNDGGSYVSRMKNSAYFDKNADVDHFIVQLSTNDASQNKTLGTVSDSYNLEDFDTQTIIGAMEYIICYAKETWDCEVSFYTGTNYNSNLYAQMVLALYELQDKWGIGVIDMFFDLEMSSIPVADYNRYMSDTIHPNIKGYEYWWTPVFEEHLMSYDYE